MTAAGHCLSARSSTLHWSRSSRGNSVDSKLLEMLVCPVTKGPLVYDRQLQELVSKSARLAYPIRDGIAIMLAEEAPRLEPAEYECAAHEECRRRMQLR